MMQEQSIYLSSLSLIDLAPRGLPSTYTILDWACANTQWFALGIIGKYQRNLIPVNGVKDESLSISRPVYKGWMTV
jgi:hypothetical protein